MFQKGITRFRKGDVVKAVFGNDIVIGVVKGIYNMQFTKIKTNFYGKLYKEREFIWCAGIDTMVEPILPLLIKLTDIIDVIERSEYPNG